LLNVPFELIVFEFLTSEIFVFVETLVVFDTFVELEKAGTEIEEGIGAGAGAGVG